MIYIFCDGGALYNGQPHGVAAWAVWITDNHSQNKSGICMRRDGTNQYAELFALHRALKAAKNFAEEYCTIVSDSMYAIRCVTEWYQNWEKNAWKNAKGEDVQHQELIKACLSLCKLSPNIQFKHIFSHCQAPRDHESLEYLLWNGNKQADWAVKQQLKCLKKQLTKQISEIETKSPSLHNTNKCIIIPHNNNTVSETKLKKSLCEHSKKREKPNVKNAKTIHEKKAKQTLDVESESFLAFLQT